MFCGKYVVLVLSLAIVSLADVITSSSYANYATNRKSQTTKNNSNTDGDGSYSSSSNGNYDVQDPVLIAARPIPTTTMSSAPAMNDFGFIPSLFSSMMQGHSFADYGPNRKNDDSGSSIDSDSNYDNGYDYYRQRYYATTSTPSPAEALKRLYYDNNNNRNNHDEDNDYNKFNKGTERDQYQRDYGDYYYRG